MFYFVFVGFCSWVNHVRSRIETETWNRRESVAGGAGAHWVLGLTSLLQCAHTWHPASLEPFTSAPFCPVWMSAILVCPMLRQGKSLPHWQNATTVAFCTWERSLVAAYPAIEQLASSSAGDYSSPLPHGCGVFVTQRLCYRLHLQKN